MTKKTHPTALRPFEPVHRETLTHSRAASAQHARGVVNGKLHGLLISYVFSSRLLNIGGDLGQFWPNIRPVVRVEVTPGNAALGDLLNTHRLLGRHRAGVFGTSRLHPLVDLSRRDIQQSGQCQLVTHQRGRFSDSIDLRCVHAHNCSIATYSKQAMLDIFIVSIAL